LALVKKKRQVARQGKKRKKKRPFLKNKKREGRVLWPLPSGKGRGKKKKKEPSEA